MNPIPAELRIRVEMRAKGICEYCKLPARGQIARFPIDHILPRSRGGSTEFDNLAFACPRCNAFEWAHLEGEDPETGISVPLFNPREQFWEEHFRWSPSDRSCIDGLTPTGRATVAKLRMNDREIVAIRRLVVELGLMTQ